MKTPRDLGGLELAKALRKLGYGVTRQSGSHLRVTTQERGEHHELEEKTSYILMNPVRKGLCERAEGWVWVYRPNDRPPPALG